MLNGIAAFIFCGNNNSNSQLPRTKTSVQEIITNDDDDWILVNNNDEENQSECSDLEVLTIPPSRASSCSSCPLTPDWNLTPPSCFERSNSQINAVETKSDGDGTPQSDLEISIFENLLIEHPSISVYYRYPRQRNVVSQQLSVRSDGESKENQIDDDDERPKNKKSSVVCERGKKSLDQWFQYTPLSISSSIVDQQRVEIAEKNRKLLCPARLRRQNLLVRQKTFYSAKKLRQLQ